MRMDVQLAFFHSHQKLIFLLILSPTQHVLAQPYSPFNTNNNGTYNSEGSPVFLIVVGIFMFLLIFFCVPFCIVRSRAANSNTTTTTTATTPNDANNNVARTKGRGVDQQVIESFPIINYAVVKHVRASKSPLECAVCLAEFVDDDSLRILPGCRHVFHVDCIDTWLAEHKTCPVCRSNLSDPQVISGKRLLSLNIEIKDVHVSPQMPSEQVEPRMGVQTSNRPRHAQSMTGWERYTLPDEVMKEIRTTERYRKSVSLHDFTNKGDASGMDVKNQGIFKSLSWKRQGKEENRVVAATEKPGSSESVDMFSRLLARPGRSENQMSEIDSEWTEIELNYLPFHERV